MHLRVVEQSGGSGFQAISGHLWGDMERCRQHGSRRCLGRAHGLGGLRSRVEIDGVTGAGGWGLPWRLMLLSGSLDVT
jgi:hypothetical protein